MSTPIERVVAELKRLDLCLPDRDREPAARAALDAALDVDELARVLADSEGANWDAAHRATWRRYARAIREHLLTTKED